MQNYAGDLALPSAGLVVRTIKGVFPSCRIFREDEPKIGEAKTDFTNMVVFCKKTDMPVNFRTPTDADFLGSGARKAFLMPQHEITADHFEKPQGRSRGLIHKGETQYLRTWQAQSAVGHWAVMRTVLPDVVWENW